MKKSARLILENGAVFNGFAFGAVDKLRSGGEVVFTTSITGYQEILTDPSFAGQIVTMTNPLMGNYGTNDEDLEGKKSYVKGFIVRELAEEYSNWRSKESLSKYLQHNDILALEGIDTRKLVRILRTDGALRGFVTTETTDSKQLIAEALGLPLMTGQDLTLGVTTSETYVVPASPS
ncbi:MAG: carbamoyl-phosphate synthase domain-containing protein, partial [bacterium]